MACLSGTILAGFAAKWAHFALRLPRAIHRSAFRDWAGDETDVAREVAEAALAHAVGNAVEQAYRRQRALDKRRALMAAWEIYCNGKPAGVPEGEAA